jgi:hypothetical protein
MLPQSDALQVAAADKPRVGTKRTKLGIPKTHALDAVCVGEVAAAHAWQKPTLAVKCTGRGSYQRTRLHRYGFPRGYLTRTRRVQGFQTGDLVRAGVPSGRKAGIHVGRVAVRATGSFNIQGAGGVVQGIAQRHCRLVQRSDGYGYSRIATSKGAARTWTASLSTLSLPAVNDGVSCATG